jgi:hypothetical protein
VNETKLFHVATIVRSIQRRVLLPAFLLTSSSVLLLSGCSSGLNFAGGNAKEPAELSEFHGSVHGGQAAVQDATVSLYEIGATSSTAVGYGAALGTPLGTAQTCDTSGNNCAGGLIPGQWSIPAPSACANSGDEIYVVASGGEEVGFTTPNAALVLTSVGGPCASQFTNSFNIDEVTTVATEYALEGFSNAYNEVGTSATNTVGLVNAFATVTNLVNLSAGTANINTPAYPQITIGAGGANTYTNGEPTNEPPDVFSSIVPYDTINTLANIIATCVNTGNGGGSGDANCSSLFQYVGGGAQAAPVGNGVQGPASVTNTADAMLWIAHNPGLPYSGGPTQNNVAAVWMLPTPEAPFSPFLTAAPNDFTLPVSYVGGGLGGGGGANSNTTNSKSVNITIDKNGGVWVTDAGSTKALTYLSNLGAPQSPDTALTSSTVASTHGGYTGFLAGPERLTSDQNGNIWISDSVDCLFEWNPSTQTDTAFTTYNAGANQYCPTDTPHSVTIDNSNNLWVGGTDFITSFTNPPAATGPRPGTFPITSGYTGLGTSLLPDNSGNVWWVDTATNSAGYVTSAGASTDLYADDFSDAIPYAALGQMSHGLALWAPESASGNTAITPVDAHTTGIFSTYSAFSTATGYSMIAIVADGNDNFWIDAGGNTGVDVPSNILEYTGVSQSPVSPVDGSTYPEGAGYQGGSALVPPLTSVEGLSIDQSGNLWIVSLTNSAPAKKIGPYGSPTDYYIGTGANASTVIEFVGLAAPTQPVDYFNAVNSTYGTKP